MGSFAALICFPVGPFVCSQGLLRINVYTPIRGSYIISIPTKAVPTVADTLWLTCGACLCRHRSRRCCGSLAALHISSLRLMNYISERPRKGWCFLSAWSMRQPCLLVYTYSHISVGLHGGVCVWQCARNSYAGITSSRSTKRCLRR